MPASVGSQKKQGKCRKTSTSPLITLKSFTVWITTDWKILKELGIPDHLTCLLRNLYAGQEATELDMEQSTCWKLGKDYVKALYYHSAYLTFLQSTSCKILGWMKHKLESRLSGEISIISYSHDTPLMAESEEEIKSLLMKQKEESEKDGLKLKVQKKTKIMASGPITS